MIVEGMQKWTMVGYNSNGKLVLVHHLITIDWDGIFCNLSLEGGSFYLLEV